jgi:hypothetical protein
MPTWFLAPIAGLKLPSLNRCGTKSRGHNRAGQGSIHLYLDWLSQSQSWSLDGQKAMGQSHVFCQDNFSKGTVAVGRRGPIWSKISKVYLGSMSRDVHSCTHWLRPRNSPPSRAFGLVYGGALLVSKDRRHLFVTP